MLHDCRSTTPGYISVSRSAWTLRWPEYGRSDYGDRATIVSRRNSPPAAARPIASAAAPAAPAPRNSRKVRCAPMPDRGDQSMPSASAPRPDTSSGPDVSRISQYAWHVVRGGTVCAHRILAIFPHRLKGGADSRGPGPLAEQLESPSTAPRCAWSVAASSTIRHYSRRDEPLSRTRGQPSARARHASSR